MAIITAACFLKRDTTARPPRMAAREKFFAKGFDARGFVDIFLAAEAKSAVGRGLPRP